MFVLTTESFDVSLFPLECSYSLSRTWFLCLLLILSVISQKAIPDLPDYSKFKYQVALYSTLCSYNLTFVSLRTPSKPENSIGRRTLSIFCLWLYPPHLKQVFSKCCWINGCISFTRHPGSVYCFVLHLLGNNPESCFCAKLTLGHSLCLTLKNAAFPRATPCHLCQDALLMPLNYPRMH